MLLLTKEFNRLFWTAQDEHLAIIKQCKDKSPSDKQKAKVIAQVKFNINHSIASRRPYICTVALMNKVVAILEHLTPEQYALLIKKDKKNSKTVDGDMTAADNSD